MSLAQGATITTWQNRHLSPRRGPFHGPKLPRALKGHLQAVAGWLLVSDHLVILQTAAGLLYLDLS